MMCWFEAQWSKQGITLFMQGIIIIQLRYYTEKNMPTHTYTVTAPTECLL